MGVNKVILVGNVGGDPEVQYLQENVPVAKFSLATSETYKNKEGERITTTEWHNIVVWRGLAKVVEQYVKKGSKLYIEGKLTNRKYEKDGVTKYFTEIVAREMQMLDGKTSENSTNQAGSNQTAQVIDKEANVISVPDFAVMDDVDDLPF